MKQAIDTKTAELPLAEPVLTPRQKNALRQKLHRERMRAAGKVPVSLLLDASVADALHKFAQFKDETLSDIVSRLLADRLLRKR